jgi:hypothetical protein
MPVDETQPESSIAVVKVLSSKTSAEEETVRLNKVNSEKHCIYRMYITRMVTIQ